MSDVSTQWPIVPLHEICRPKQWPTIPQTAFLAEGYPVYGANGVIGYYSEFNHEKPTVLITCRGATCGTINLCAPKSYVTGNAMALDDLDEARVELRYLVRALQNGSLRKAISGTAQPQITRDGLTVISIPLPPLTEQRRIAGVLDRTDALRAKRRAALAQIDSLTQSIFLDMFGDPTVNPTGLSKGVLGHVAKFVGGGTPSRARPEYFAGSICWATSKDMKCEFLDNTEEHITQQAVEDSATKIVPAGAILVVVKSKILAHHLPVAVARVPTCFGQDLKGIVLNDGFEVSFVATSLRLGKKWLLERARGINTEGLTLDHLRAFPMLTPAKNLQRDFARCVAEVEKLRAAHRVSLAELDALFAVLQHRAFRGEL